MRLNMLFGLYVMCFNEGFFLEDLDCWVLYLDDLFILLFFVKLLLEIDLGIDLNGCIEVVFDGDEEEMLYLFFLDIYEEYKWDLDYGDVIDVCFCYYVE